MGTNSIKTLRLHDKFYLNENRYNEPKEIFIYLLNLIKKNRLIKSKLSVGDFGCSNGEFCYFLKKNFDNFDITGYDVLTDLISKARKKVKNVKFKHG